MFLRPLIPTLTLLSFAFSVNGQIPFHSTDQKLQAADVIKSDSEKELPLPPQHTWKENISARTLYTNSFTTPDGRIVNRYSKRPINYYNAAGELIPIDPSMKYSGDGWSAP